jgi:hypothetical protein
MNRTKAEWRAFVRDQPLDGNVLTAKLSVYSPDGKLIWEQLFDPAVGYGWQAPGLVVVGRVEVGPARLT